MSSVLSPVSFLPPTPPTPPSAVQAAADAISSGIQALFVQNVKERIRIYNLFWNNPGKGCDPASIAAQLGTQLASGFQADAALVEFLATQAASANPAVSLPPEATAGIPAGYTFTPNMDGSGVVTKA